VESDPESFENKLAALKQAYLDSLPAMFEEMDQVVACIEKSLFSPDCLEDMETLHQLAHKLVGSGATFGIPALSEVAEEIEATAKAVVEAETPLSADQWQTVKDMLESLRRVVDEAASLEKT